MFIRNKKIVWIILGVLIGANILVLIIVWELSRPPILEVVFFDVGQGDSIYIETSDGFQILIDGGPDLTVLEKLAKEMPFYDRTIDLVILTHPDHDHLFGLLEVLKRYQVKNILWTGVIKDTDEYKEWEKLIREEGADIIIAQAGQKINLTQDAYFLIFHPFESLENLGVEDSNDTSVVAQLVFNDNSFLFAGDISQKIELKLIDQNQELDSDILKVAHHGGKNSSSLGFLRAVSPETAVISVGENSYGHPAPEVLQRLEQFGIDILITKESGDIRFSF
ncbi:MAG: ComEC/Rec2 family competence protein [bacterium]|nr:ComEC/Rec2 family competence protein [bacterium]